MSTVDIPTPAIELRQLSRRERKDLGLTFRDLLSEIRDMKKAGTLEGKTSEEVTAEILTARMEIPAFKAILGGQIDWDAVFAFIERLVDLIMKLIAAFGVL